MKRILFFILLLFCNHCFTQPENTDITNQLIQFERQNFEKRHALKNLSLASSNFEVNYYRCGWKIDPAVRYINGSVTSYFNILTATNNIVYDFTNQLGVDSIIFHKQKIAFSQTLDNTLVINFPSFLSAGTKDSVSVFYKGIPPGSGDFTGGFVQSAHEGVPVIWTLSEPYGAAGWWPCRNGLDDKADSIDIYITCPSQYKASANGILVDTLTIINNTISHYRHHYPIASYLVAFAVTNYSVFTTTVDVNNVTVPVIQYIYPEDLAGFKNKTYLFLNALKLFSTYFGTYPFYKERYGQTEFGFGGGMEHQTNSFVKSADEILMVHELAHQWFGDKVTCGSWQDIWLNEGFAEWMATMFYTEKIDTKSYYISVLNDLKDIVSQPNGSVWVDDTTNSNRIFNSRLSYHKGAFLLRMLRWTLGDSAFFAGLNNYLNDTALAYGFARTADLQRNLQNVSGVNLDDFFNQWFYGQGFPSFKLQWYQQPLSGKLYFKVDESASDPSSINFFKVKLPVQLINGADTQTIALQCDNNDQVFILNNPGYIVTGIVIDSDKFIISANDTVSNNKDAFKDVLNGTTAKVTVVPNPVSGIATVTLNNILGNTRVQLFSITGSLLFNKTINVTQTPATLQIPFSNLASATYKLVVTEENGTKHHLTILK